MWINSQFKHKDLENYFKLIGRLVFLCQKVENTTTLYATMTEFLKNHPTRKARIEAQQKIFSKSLGNKIDIILKHFTDEQIEELKGLYDKARISRNYIAHESMRFATNVLDVDNIYSSEDQVLLSEKINMELKSLYAHAINIINLEDIYNEDEWYCNNKDSSSYIRPKNYRNKITRWLFQDYPQHLSS